jgi:hypothetical protein
MLCCAVVIFTLLTPSLDCCMTLAFVRWDQFHC